MHNSWHYVRGGYNSVGATVVSFPCDTCSAPHFFGGHASLRRCETFHTTDLPVSAADFGHDGTVAVFRHYLCSSGILPFLA